ncbi:MAG: hypothetical protein R3325_15390, partial [Thermoanaerobaculia bacterium]|nr:hypothetical protein [Thermoanaerobaculia bacterium]
MTAAGRPRAEPRPPARLVEALEASLDGPRRRALAAARAVSAARGEAVYLVGGAVRDLLLGRSAPDLDLVVAGDGSGFAGDLAALLDATCTRHRRFLTAVVSWPGGPRLDLASSRREVYEAPGALPRVEPAPLAEDLARRDFTVNAMALELAPESGRLLDPHGGCEDLRRRLLRVLHPGSFLDDPTRIVRGLLFEHRFDLRFEPETERLARGALADGGLARLSRDRRSAALAPLLARLLEAPSLARRMGGLGLFAALHPELAPRAEEEGRLRRFADLRGELAAASPPVEVAAEWAAAVALLWRRERAVWRAVGADLGLDATASELPRRVRRLSAALGAEGIPPHRVDALLREL